MVNKQKDINKLWEQLFKTRSIEIRNELIMRYLNLVKIIVHKMMPAYNNYNSFDDLINYGVLGLIDAIDKFDLSKNVKFETYASIRIRGHIIDCIRKQDWVPANIRAKVKQVNETYMKLENSNGRPATDEEVASHLGISMNELNKILEDSHTMNILYIDEVSNTPDLNDSFADEYEKGEIKRIIIELLDTLTEQERMVVTLYYYENLNMKEIAMTLGVTESRVSQIHSKLLIKLRGKLKQKLDF